MTSETHFSFTSKQGRVVDGCTSTPAGCEKTTSDIYPKLEHEANTITYVACICTIWAVDGL